MAASGWSFLKRSSSTDKKPSKYAKYEQNRGQRTLKEDWKKERPWLIFNHDNNSMKCAWCSSVTQPSVPNQYVWTTGKLETLKSHQSSKVHVRSAEIIAGRALPAAETEAIKAIHTINKAETEKLAILFRNAHALALSGRPFTDFVWLTKLDSVKGLDVGKTYINDKRAREFTDSIASVERTKIADHLKSAHYVSIMSDGSTDSSITEAEIIYLRMCFEGVVKVYFVNCALVERGDAPSIVQAMKRSVEKLDYPWVDFISKLVGMGSDGASVMLGSKNGVAAILRKEQPAMVAVHCYAHKLELAFKDAIKNVSLDSKVTECLLQGLYYLYHNSPLNRSNLKDSFKALGTKPVMPTRIGGTRWVAHLLRALVNFMQGYHAIKQHLEQINSSTERVSASTKGKAKGILKLILSRDVILYVHYMADVVTVLVRLSKIFQERACSAADVHGIVEETMHLIEVYGRKWAILKKALALLDLSEEWNMRQNPGESFLSARQKLIDGLLGSLTGRFEMTDIIKSTKIANFTMWPLVEDCQEIEEFGDHELPQILTHYEQQLGSRVDSVEVLVEWTALKRTLYANRPNDIKSLTWDRVHRMFPSDYRNILSVMDLILTIPGSSSECERGFRQMKSIKTTFRSSMLEESLSSCLTIKLHSASIEEFDPIPAIGVWMTGSRRRPSYMDKSAAVETERHSEDSSSEEDSCSD